MPRPLVGLVLSVTLAVLAAGCGEGRPTEEAGCTPRGVISVGERMPDCSFDLRGGGRLALRDLEDKPVVLNFWASWCIACIKEMPAFDRVWADLKDEIHVVGMDVIGVQGETRQAAERFLTRTPVAYPIAFDDDANLYEHFAMSKARPIMPVTIFISPGGIVQARRFGEMSESELRGYIRDELDV